MSISRKDRVNFLIIFWIVHYFVTKLGKLTGIVLSNIFKKRFVRFGKMGLKCGLISIYQLAAIDQKPIMKSFRFFTPLKGSTDKSNIYYKLSTAN